MTCISKVDDSRCLLGDANGRLHMLFLEMEKMDAEATTVATETKQAFGVANLKLELLGGEVREKLG